ncbi:MAG: hypothetical protein CL920_19620 [Deltaproteobacteria bacterium]|nr:hypothetical protein [Deltaproteobacteria bacterium]|tara:strand:- start:353 stop:598 length:246 start_codon:yes stop_codon:yes gene_type:complete
MKTLGLLLVIFVSVVFIVVSSLGPLMFSRKKRAEQRRKDREWAQALLEAERKQKEAEQTSSEVEQTEQAEQEEVPTETKEA